MLQHGLTPLLRPHCCATLCIKALLNTLVVCMQLVKADLRFKDSVPAGLMDGVQAVVCCTGTTAFPTNRCEEVWEYEGCCI